MEKTVLAVHIEADAVKISLFRCKGSSLELVEGRGSSWDCKSFTVAGDGLRLFEEIGRRVARVIRTTQLQPALIAVGLPGVINGTCEITRSSRLGIFSAVNVAEIFEKQRLPPVELYRDVDCLCAISKAKDGPAYLAKDFLFVHADEGVGSSIVIGGKNYRGAGYAGPIGRLVVEPDGGFSRVFRSHGPLENYVSRPAISEFMVSLFLSEQNKRNAYEEVSEPFRLALKAASEADARDISYRMMRMGIEAGDPIAQIATDRASKYFGLALSNVITILNPPLIVLSGGLVSSLPTFHKSALEYARKFSWLQAWNSTSFASIHGTGESCALGAALCHLQKDEA